MGGRSLRPPLFFAAPCNVDQSAMAAGRQEQTCAVLEGGSVFSDPLAVD